MPLNPIHQAVTQEHTRRHFLGQSALGLGGLVLQSLMGVPSQAAEPESADQHPLAAKPPHFAPKAKRVIYIHLVGSPPQHDLLDYKPALQKHDGDAAPAELFEGQRFAFIEGTPRLLASPYAFAPAGQNGLPVSELLPHFREIIDDVCLVRSMHTDQFNHAPAQLLLQTGSAVPGRPSMGSWLTYGLGSENRDLPGFIVLASGGAKPGGGPALWNSGFLPTIHSGVQCRSEGPAVLNLENPPGISRRTRRDSLDAIHALNEVEAEHFGDPETRSRIQQYEMAFRMQVSVPGVMSIDDETPGTLEQYGAVPGDATFANNCLLARKLAEADVRFIQLYDWGWDMHGIDTTTDLITALPKKCRETDRPIAALVKDLKQRGLLDDTLVVWSGEFGRTAMNEYRDGSRFLGRDHHPGAFTIWMAGGGVKPGLIYGRTDDFSHTIAENPVHVHDLQATILHLLGLDHERLTYRYQGRDFRLTDVHGHVVHDLIS